MVSNSGNWFCAKDDKDICYLGKVFYLF